MAKWNVGNMAYNAQWKAIRTQLQQMLSPEKVKLWNSKQLQAAHDFVRSLLSNPEELFEISRK